MENYQIAAGKIIITFEKLPAHKAVTERHSSHQPAKKLPLSCSYSIISRLAGKDEA